MDNLQIFDDFLPDPESFRETAIAEQYGVVAGPDGGSYRDMNVRPVDEFKELLEARLGRPIKQSFTLLRVNYEDALPHDIHSDNGCDTAAAVLYLNPTFVGGTAFWRHKKLGYTQMPSEQEIRRFGKSPARVLKTLQASNNKVDDWAMTRLASGNFNRCIVYSTRLFHSRWPIIGFGNEIQTARRVWCSFFS